jgi:hypothetical protein
MDSQVVEKLIRDYKYSNVPLEKTIIQILALDNISAGCLKEERSVEILTSLSFMLVDYKFNRTNRSGGLTATDIITWVKENGNKLKSPYSGGGTTWG